MSQYLARATFVLLILATVAAFFVAQRLKKTTPLVGNVRVTKFFSPDGNGYKDMARLSFITKRADRVTVSVVDEDDNEVRRLASDRHLPKGRHVYHWNGRYDAGVRVPDGVYYLRVGLRNEGRTATTPKKIFLDTKPPRPVVLAISPDWISPGASSGEVATIHIAGPVRAKPEFLVYRAGVKHVRLVTRFRGRSGSTVARWNGRAAGRPVPAGNYFVAVRVRDAAGNLGSGPPRLPPERGETRGHPGVVVRYIAAVPPQGPLTGGSVARLEIRTHATNYRWRLRWLGSGKLVDRGRARGKLLQFRVPKSRAGVYILELRTGSHLFKTPLAVANGKRRPVLLVISTTTWQAQNPLDSNGDGWADVIGTVRKVPLRRPYALGLPTGFATLEAPLLRWLDREKLTFELITDYALSEGNGSELKGKRSVVFAGSEIYPTKRLVRRIRDFLSDGGSVASLGSGAFRRTASLTSRKLFDPTPGRRRDAFGEKLALTEQPPGPIAALEDEVELFSGTGGSFGEFVVLEQSEKLPPGARLLAAAGQSSDQPSMVLYRDGKGLVFRSGSEQWNRNLRSSEQLRLIMRRIWKLLSR